MSLGTNVVQASLIKRLRKNKAKIQSHNELE